MLAVLEWAGVAHKIAGLLSAADRGLKSFFCKRCFTMLT